MIGWIVENRRRSGWRQKCRRFRIVTTAMSLTLDWTSRSDNAVGRHSRRAGSTGISATAGVISIAQARSGRRPDCLIQVNIGHEPQKAGVLPADLAQLVALCRDQLVLPLAGLMAIPPVDQPAAPYFARLAELAQHHRLPTLSMGMSADFEAAIRAGATLVRVGTAIFGSRTYV